MRVCFKSTAYLFLAGTCLVSGRALAGDIAPSHVLTSVVRVDSKSGRLTRTTIVTPRRAANPKPIVAKVIAPLPVDGEISPAMVLTGDLNLQQIVEDSARRNEVDPLLVHSVIQVESNYNANAVSPKGAQGLMQLIPSTARRFGANNSFDVRENVEAGVKYLKYLNSLYPNDLRLTLAAYNAGEGAVAKYRNTIPPYPETEHYVYKVGEKYGSARRAAERNKTAAVHSPDKTAAIEKHLPVESYVDSDGGLHLRTVIPAEGIPQ